MPKSKGNKKKKKTAQKSQQRGWREFEKLVYQIEKTLAPKDAIVKSPDYIKDKFTDESREVDASIKYKVGSTEILVIIECRDRKKIQDTIWIEQLISKQVSLNAAKCIAVSSNGFTKPAMKKAKLNGIEIRLVKNITDKIINNWTPTKTWFYNYQLNHTELGFIKDDMIKPDHDFDDMMNAELAKKHHLDERILIHKKSGDKISIRKYFQGVLDFSLSEMKPEERVKIEIDKELILSWSEEPLYYVESSKGNIDIICIAVKVIFKWITDFSITPISAYEYSNESEKIVDRIDFEITSNENTRNITIQTSGRNNIIEPSKPKFE